jgi:hypothetical protein
MFYLSLMIYLWEVRIIFYPSGHTLENMKTWGVADFGRPVPSLTEVYGNETVLTE